MLSVVFGKTTPVYQPREEVLGDVVICVTNKCRILDLTVNYVGISSVGFVISQGISRSETCNKVEETDTHLDVLHPLVKSYRGVEIDPGVHTYSFAFCLPELLPSSYNSPYGQISYYLQVHLQTSDTTLDLRSHFFIRASVNINLFKSSQCPQCAEVTKKYGIFGTTTFLLKTSLCKTGFVPGDVISVLIDTENRTSRRLRYLFCTLKQITQVVVKLQDQTENRVTTQNLVTICHKVTEKRARYSWHCQLRSPTFLTPTISASTIVFVTYVIQVSAKLTRVTIPPQVQIPIVFGTRTSISSNESAACYTNSTRHRRSLQDGIFSDNIPPHESNPTVTNPRRRVTICSQPKYSLLDTSSQSAGSQYQRHRNKALDVLEEEDLVCNVENLCNSNQNLSTPNQRRRYTICTQPKLLNLLTQKERQEDLTDCHDTNHPNAKSDLCVLSENSVNISLVSDLRRRLSVFCQKDSNLPYSIVDSHEQEGDISKHKEIKNSFKADHDYVFPKSPQHIIENPQQPTRNKSIFSNTTKKVGNQLQTIASQVSQCLNNQWLSNFPNQFKRFDCEHM